MKIIDEGKKKAIVEALFDDQSRTILYSTTDTAKPVVDIMKETNIPMTSAYRKVKDLLKVNLLRTEGSEITEDGKRFYLYRSNINEAKLIYKNGDIEINIEPNTQKDQPEDKLLKTFTTMKGRE
jgi:predicted transcriptional regulator